MNFCFKEKAQEAAELIQKPVVKNKVSWNMGVYKNENASKPEVSFDVNSDTEVKLIAVLAVTATVLLTACALRKFCKMFTHTPR